jgi:hypothetical protein
MRGTLKFEVYRKDQGPRGQRSTKLAFFESLENTTVAYVEPTTDPRASSCAA